MSSRLYRVNIRGIIAELAFNPKHKKHKGFVIVCPGMPSIPKAEKSLQLWVKKGYIALLFRYRGTWESTGKFLENSPVDDVKEILLARKNGFIDVWSNELICLEIKNLPVVIAGSSFGGAVALCANQLPEVKVVVAISPVVDWFSLESGTEPMSLFVPMVERAFQDAYRIGGKGLEGLSTNDMLNPEVIKKVDLSSSLVVYSTNDPIVPFLPIQKFVQEKSIENIELSHGEHLSFSRLPWGVQRKMFKFLEKNI